MILFLFSLQGVKFPLVLFIQCVGDVDPGSTLLEKSFELLLLFLFKIKFMTNSGILIVITVNVIQKKSK